MNKELFNEFYMKIVNDEVDLENNNMFIMLAEEIMKNEKKKEEKIKETRERIW